MATKLRAKEKTIRQEKGIRTTLGDIIAEGTDDYLIVGDRNGNGIILRRGQTSLSQEALVSIAEERIQRT